MDEQNHQEFSLEDIIREFSDHPAAPPADEVPAVEAPADEVPTDEVPAVEVPADEVPAVEVPVEEVPADEVPAAVTSDTIRLDTTKFTHGTARNAQIIDDEEDEADAPGEVPADAQEEFPEGWEPQYEQPMGEYVPPQPIIFHPRSRLRELKKKLVNGPEKQYYALSEKGLGKLQAGIFFSLLASLTCAITTFLFAFEMVSESRLRLVAFIQFLALLVGALAGSSVLIDGAAELLRKRFTQRSLLLFTFIACVADGIVALQQQRISCCAAFTLSMTMALWSAYQQRNTQIGEMDTMRKATSLDAVGVAENYYTLPGKKEPVCVAGFVRHEGQVEDFMDHYDDTWSTQTVLDRYALIGLLVSCAIGITGGIISGWQAGIQTFAVCTLASMPATAFISQTRPMALLERRLHKVGAVLCGWKGVKLLCGKAVFPISLEDLFPSGTVKMNGVKFFGQAEPDEVVSCVSALVEASGSSLNALFGQLLASRNARHYTAQDVTLHENGGISGMVNGHRVIAGSLSFLREENVEVPEGVRVSSAVYVALNSELSGLFALSYEKDRAAQAGISALCAYRDLTPLVCSDEFVLTHGFLHSKLGVPENKVLLPSFEERYALRQKDTDTQNRVALLVTKPNLAAYAYAVTGARTLYSACRTGVAIHLLGGILGLVMMLVLTLLGAVHLLTSVNMFAYQLVWLIPGLLITEWSRHV